MLVCRAALAPRCATKTPYVRLYHSSPVLAAGRDFNSFMRVDTRVTLNTIRKKLFKKESGMDKPALSTPQQVAFVPPLMPDEIAPVVPVTKPEIQHPPQDNEYPRVPKAKYPKISPYGTVTGSGKRKTAKAVAAIFSPGTGQITINGKHWMDYFPQSTMLEPIIASEKFNNVDIKCKVTGGGFMGQAGAIKNALANALVNGFSDALPGDPEYRFLMESNGWLVPDHRQKERKHTGLRKARRRQQWVKR